METVKLPDHQQRLHRARFSLEVLSLGDAFGDRFFVNLEQLPFLLMNRALPSAPWLWTDDTAMATSIYQILEQHGCINQDALAYAFGQSYANQPDRGYGGTAHSILRMIATGEPWKQVSSVVFEGQGSMGNGAAMRAAPIGAYFADNLEKVCEQAFLSAQITHMHPDGQAGAVAVAVATALMYQMCQAGTFERATFMQQVFEKTPAGFTRDKLAVACTLDPDMSLNSLIAILGNGSRVISSDTVPLCIWNAAKFVGQFEEAMWGTVSAFGDRDTTCAIVGGILAMSIEPEQLPGPWLEARESLLLSPNDE
jgi:ADP-ribosylglycohydrolase